MTTTIRIYHDDKLITNIYIFDNTHFLPGYRIGKKICIIIPRVSVHN